MKAKLLLIGGTVAGLFLYAVSPTTIVVGTVPPEQKETCVYKGKTLSDAECTEFLNRHSKGHWQS